MNANQCQRRHPVYGDECHKFSGNDHVEHRNMVTKRSWTDADYESTAAKADYHELLKFVQWAADPDCPLPCDMRKDEHWGAAIKRHARELLNELKVSPAVTTKCRPGRPKS